jgi:hypothetical protein
LLAATCMAMSRASSALPPFRDNHNTDLVAVQVSTNYVTFNAHQTTNVDVFAYFADQYQTSSFLSGDQRSNVGQFVSERFFNASSNEILKSSCRARKSVCEFTSSKRQTCYRLQLSLR